MCHPDRDTHLEEFWGVAGEHRGRPDSDTVLTSRCIACFAQTTHNQRPNSRQVDCVANRFCVLDRLHVELDLVGSVRPVRLIAENSNSMPIFRLCVMKIDACGVCHVLRLRLVCLRGDLLAPKKKYCLALAPLNVQERNCDNS